MSEVIPSKTVAVYMEFKRKMLNLGLDENNSDDFCKVFADIEDQFKEQRFDIALSRLKACRSVFVYSDLYRIHDIFMEDNFIILKMLFFKSYVD